MFDFDFVSVAQTAAEAFPVFGGIGLEAACQDAGEPVLGEAFLVFAVLDLELFQDAGQELLGAVRA